MTTLNERAANRRSRFGLLTPSLALLPLVACADILGVNDKQVITDEQYDHYLATGEIVDPGKIPAGGGPFDDDPPYTTGGVGAGGASSDFPMSPTPGGTTGGTASGGATGGTTGGTASGGTPSDVEPSPTIDFSAYGAEFSNGYLYTETLQGFLMVDDVGAEYPPSPLDDQTEPPYCVPGLLQPDGLMLMGVVLDPSVVPSYEGLLVDFTTTETTELLLQIVGDDGSAWCVPLAAQGPAFVAWSEFRSNCFDSGTPAEPYDHATPLVLAGLMATNRQPSPVDFDMCLFGMVEY